MEIDGPFIFSNDVGRGGRTANHLVGCIRESTVLIFRVRLAAGDIESSRAVTALCEELDRLVSEVAALRKKLADMVE